MKARVFSNKVGLFANELVEPSAAESDQNQLPRIPQTPRLLPWLAFASLRGFASWRETQQSNRLFLARDATSRQDAKQFAHTMSWTMVCELT